MSVRLTLRVCSSPVERSVRREERNGTRSGGAIVMARRGDMLARRYPQYVGDDQIERRTMWWGRRQDSRWSGRLLLSIRLFLERHVGCVM